MSHPQSAGKRLRRDARCRPLSPGLSPGGYLSDENCADDCSCFSRSSCALAGDDDGHVLRHGLSAASPDRIARRKIGAAHFALSARYAHGQPWPP